MKQPIRIYLIDDHQIIRDGLKALVHSEKDIAIVGESDGKFLDVNMIIQTNPDVILMDISMGEISGLEFSSYLITQNKDIRIIILSMFNNQESVTKAIETGVMGYLSKNSSKEEIINAIRQVHDGKKYFNNEITDIILQSMLESGSKIKEPTDEPCVECLTQEN